MSRIHDGRSHVAKKREGRGGRGAYSARRGWRGCPWRAPYACARGGGSIKTARASKHYLIFIYLLYQYFIIALFVEYKVYIHIHIYYICPRYVLRSQ